MRLRRSISFLLVFVLCVGMLVLEPTEVQAANVSIPIEVCYFPDGSRNMLSRVNSFRTGSDAWAYDSSGQKVSYSGLKSLTYDYDLEKIAMTRAAEIALSYSHTRPNGERFTTAYTNYSCKYMAENIGVGYYTADEVFTAWREDNKDYSGQGHRRNMLDSNYTAIGIAHLSYQGRDYWVQEFGSSIQNTTKTTVLCEYTTVNVEVSQSNITKIGVNKSSITVGKGESISLSDIKILLAISGYSRSGYCSTLLDYSLSVGDGTIASLSGTTLTGNKTGSTTLAVTALGQTMTVPVTVSAAGDSSGTASDSNSATKKLVLGKTFTYSGMADYYEWTGNPITPELQYYYNGTKLNASDSLEIVYYNNIDSGTASMYITGKNGYSGSVWINFSIVRTAETEKETETETEKETVTDTEKKDETTDESTSTSSGSTSSSGSSVSSTPSASTLKAAVTVSPKSITLKKGKFFWVKFKGTLLPYKSYLKKITYKSSNKKVATVTKNGFVRAKKKGTATITSKVYFKNGVTKTVKTKVKVH